MTAPEAGVAETREAAARLAFALIRFAGTAAHPRLSVTPPGVPEVGTEAYIFGPSWRRVLHHEVEAFLVGLPSPALMTLTLTRGEIALTLVHELTGDRRRWAEKSLSNLLAGLDENASQLGLPATARILVEFEDESHIFPLAAVRHWAEQLAVNVGCSIAPLRDDEHADACLMLLRPDGREFPGRSCMLRGRTSGSGVVA